MPCNSDYMEPNDAEKNSQQVAKFLIYVMEQTGSNPTGRVRRVAESCYGDPRQLNEFTTHLCSMLKGLSKLQAEKVLYNAHDKTSRELASWWEKHLEADKNREAKEQTEYERKSLVQSGLKKLTPEEKKAMGF